MNAHAPTLEQMFEQVMRTGQVRRLLELAREEDLGSAAGGSAGVDVTSECTIDAAATGTARLMARGA